MKILCITLLLVSVAGCCISKDTKILARKIANSTATQAVELNALSDLKLENGQKISETRMGSTLLKRAVRLGEATAGLADLVGAPEEVE
jgi:hypothetical protein